MRYAKHTLYTIRRAQPRRKGVQYNILLYVTHIKVPPDKSTTYTKVAHKQNKLKITHVFK